MESINDLLDKIYAHKDFIGGRIFIRDDIRNLFKKKIKSFTEEEFSLLCLRIKNFRDYFEAASWYEDDSIFDVWNSIIQEIKSERKNKRK